MLQEAGGLPSGFEAEGFKILLGIDSDAKAIATFALNRKGVKTIYGDITQIGYKRKSNLY